MRCGARPSPATGQSRITVIMKTNKQRNNHPFTTFRGKFAACHQNARGSYQAATNVSQRTVKKNDSKVNHWMRSCGVQNGTGGATCSVVNSIKKFPRVENLCVRRGRQKHLEHASQCSLAQSTTDTQFSTTPREPPLQCSSTLRREKRRRPNLKATKCVGALLCNLFVHTETVNV